MLLLYIASDLYFLYRFSNHGSEYRMLYKAWALLGHTLIRGCIQSHAQPSKLQVVAMVLC